MKMPRFNSISISGYHMQEAGASADLELAYTLADGVDYIRSGLAAGLKIDDFAPRLSFFFGIGMNMFTEIAKLRAARLLWARLVAPFAPRSDKSLALRTHCQTSGMVARGAGSVQQRQSAPWSRRWRRRRAARSRSTPTLSTKRWRCRPTSPPASPATPRLMLQIEGGTTRTIDPWGGSYFRRTSDRRSRGTCLGPYRGGRAARRDDPKAIEAGVPKARIEEAAAETQARIDAGRQAVIGVNRYPPGGGGAARRAEASTMSVVRAAQVAKLERLRAERDGSPRSTALSKALTGAASSGDGNLLDLAVCGRAGQGDGRRNLGRAGKGVGSSQGERSRFRSRASIAVPRATTMAATRAIMRVARPDGSLRRGSRREAAHPRREGRAGRTRPRPEGHRLGLLGSRFRRPGRSLCSRRRDEVAEQALAEKACTSSASRRSRPGT